MFEGQNDLRRLHRENDCELVPWKEDGSGGGGDEGASALLPSGQALTCSKNSEYGQRLGSSGGMLATPI